jgi:hypothetical protein
MKKALVLSLILLLVQSLAVGIIYAGAPAFDVNCPTQKIVPRYSAIELRCKVSSDTDLSNLYFYWHQYLVIHLKDDEVTDGEEFRVVENNASKIILLPSTKADPLHSGSANTTTWARKGGYIGLVFPQSDGSAVLELKILRMVDQMYRRHFFVAENDKGTAEYVIELKRDPNDVEDNSATTAASSAISILTVFALTALFH